MSFFVVRYYQRNSSADFLTESEYFRVKLLKSSRSAHIGNRVLCHGGIDFEASYTEETG
jgi:hypothetical protein